jgi:hypothetical protein
VRFERAEAAALRPLPAHPLPVRQRRLARKVSSDCFVEVDTVRYSVPHALVRRSVEVVCRRHRGRRVRRHGDRRAARTVFGAASARGRRVTTTDQVATGDFARPLADYAAAAGGAW